MSWVAGVDFSTHAVDVVLVDMDGSEPPQWHLFTLKGMDAFDRARLLLHGDDALDEGGGDRWGAVWSADVLAIGIEDPRGHNAGALYRIQGAILANLPAKTLVVPWIPSAWRKAVGLKGNATKAEVKVFADAMIPRKSPDDRPQWPEQDAADAYCIALATRGAITVWEEAA